MTESAAVEPEPVATQAGVARRVRRCARGLGPDGWALLAVACAVLLANLPYLLGLFDQNPMAPASALMQSHVPGLLPGAETIDANSGSISQALGHRAVLDLLHLQLPWWNPLEGTGAPLAGEMQSAALFPPTLLTAFANGQLYEHMLLEFIGGGSMYLLMRRIVASRWAALGAAIAFALNGTFAWFAHAAVNPVAVLPMLLLGIELALHATTAKRRGGWWLISVAGALAIYAGFPETALIDVLMAVFWLGWRCVGLPRPDLRVFAGKVLAGGLCGALLAAPLLVAMIVTLGHSYLSIHGTASFGSRHIAGHELPQLLLPYVYGPIDAFADPKLQLTQMWASVGGYLSTSLLLFALLGLCSRGPRGLQLALTAWLVLALGRTYGIPGLGAVLGLLPGMSRIVFFRYATPSIELSVIVLAGLGIDALARAPAPRRPAALGALGLVAAAAIEARPLANQLGSAFNHGVYYALAVIWGAGIVIVGLALLALRNPVLRVRLVALLVSCDAIVLFALPEFSAARSVKIDTAPVSYLQQHLGESRFFTLGPLQPNYGSYFGVAALNVDDDPLPSNFAGFVRRHIDRSVDPSQLVGYTSLARPLGAPAPQAELLGNLSGYRSAGVAYVLTGPGDELPGAQGFTRVLSSPTTWIYHLAGAAPYFSSATPGCRVSFASRDAADVACRRTTTLIRRETAFPGWEAQVDGHRVPERASGPFQAVSLPPGTHHVSFSYQPPYAWLGWLSWLGGPPGYCRASPGGGSSLGGPAPVGQQIGRKAPAVVPASDEHKARRRHRADVQEAGDLLVEDHVARPAGPDV